MNLRTSEYVLLEMVECCTVGPNDLNLRAEGRVPQKF